MIYMNLLPTEIRQIVYSKMIFEDRVNMARASEEARLYFMKRPTIVPHIFVYAVDRDGSRSIRVNFGHRYEERYSLSPEMNYLLRHEFESYESCRCPFCRQGKDSWVPLFKEPVKVRNFEWTCVDDLFTTMRMTKAECLHIRTAPNGGLLEQLQPIGNLSTTCLSIWWHELSTEDPLWTVNTKKVQAWITFALPSTIMWKCPYSWNFVPNGIFDMEQVQNVPRLAISGHTPITVDQLQSLKNKELFICSSTVSTADRQSYFKKKIQHWLNTQEEGCFKLGPVPELKFLAWPRASHLDYLRETLQECMMENELPDHYTISTHLDQEIPAVELKNTKTKSTLRVERVGIKFVNEENSLLRLR